MTVFVTFQGNTYPIPETGETGWGNLTDYLVALANAASTSNALQSIRTSTAASTTVQAIDYTVLINFAGAATVTLPVGITKTIYCIFDTSGNAVTNNITINPSGGQLIDQDASYVIKSNYGGIMVQFDGVKWKVLCERLNNQITVRNNSTNTSFVDAGMIGRSAFASAPDNTSCSASFTGSNTIHFLISLSTGESILCHASFLSDQITAVSDISNIFVNDVSGTNQIAVSKSASSSTVSIKNNMGGSRLIEIRALTNRIVSPTAWA